MSPASPHAAAAAGLQAPLTLSRAVHDRAAHLRIDGSELARAWADPRARVLRVHESTCLTTDTGELALLTSAQVEASGAAVLERYFLGNDPDGTPLFAVAGPYEPGPGQRATNLREVSASWPDRDAGLFVHAVGLANWHLLHGFCPRCGGRTAPEAAGHVRRCEACGAQQFPRCDPAVIMLVVDDEDRTLLGHNPAWPPGRFSTLAGFVEPGESCEQAVVREVFEEVGVPVDSVTYEGSQPWPLPSSLMLGFRARAADTALRIDKEEITEARWFSREELRAAWRTRDVLVPPGVSIARWLIERWYGEPIPREGDW